MSRLTAYYIDDESFKEDTARHAKRLSRDQKFICQLIPPPELSELDKILSTPPNLFLIDYQLSQAQQDGSKVSYRGTTLAAEIRARLPDIPIVLITRPTVLAGLNRQTKRQIMEKTQPCDELLFKEQIDDNLDGTRQLLVSLVQGFNALRESKDRNWDSLVALLKATEGESKILREAAPPLREREWIVTGAAEWIRNVLLEYPGIVYDPLNAATRLGISVESFLSKEVQRWSAPTRYQGIFAPAEGRWWKNRLFKLSKQLTIEQGVSGSQTHSFAEAFKKKFHKKLDPAVCVWALTPTADWVCYILKKPVKIKNSLRYYPDSRPSVMDDARASFRAVRESNDFDEKLLDSEGISLWEEIKSLPEPQP